MCDATGKLAEAFEALRLLVLLLDPLLRGDVLDHRDPCGPASEVNLVRGHDRPENGAVLPAEAGRTISGVRLSDPGRHVFQLPALGIVCRHVELAAQDGLELIPGVAERLNGRFVDIDELASVRGGDRHRQRARLEQLRICPLGAHALIQLTLERPDQGVDVLS